MSMRGGANHWISLALNRNTGCALTALSRLMFSLSSTRTSLQAGFAIHSLGFEAQFQLICPKARKKWREIALRCDAGILIDHQKLFLLIAPCWPIGQARSVRVTCPCEVGPIGLQQVGQRRIILS